MIPGAPSTPPAPKDPAAQAQARAAAASGAVRTVATIVQGLPLEALIDERERLAAYPDRDHDRRRIGLIIALREELDTIDRQARA
jgi:hypothetical protein